MTSDARLQWTATRAFVEDWLERTPPTAPVMWADRALIRLMMDPDVAVDRDREWLCANASEVTRQLSRTVDGRTAEDPTLFFVLLDAWRRWGVPEARTLEAIAERRERQWRAWIAALDEPFRSAGGFWGIRAIGWEPLPRGRRPDHPVLRAYDDLHQLLYATAYGATPVARAGLGADLARVVTDLDDTLDAAGLGENADLIAEAVLVELFLRPVRRARVRDLLHDLCGHVTESGVQSLGPVPVQLTQTHHAACVAVCALQRAIADARL